MGTGSFFRDTLFFFFFVFFIICEGCRVRSPLEGPQVRRPGQWHGSSTACVLRGELGADVRGRRSLAEALPRFAGIVNGQLRSWFRRLVQMRT